MTLRRINSWAHDRAENFFGSSKIHINHMNFVLWIMVLGELKGLRTLLGSSVIIRMPNLDDNTVGCIRVATANERWFFNPSRLAISRHTIVVRGLKTRRRNWTQ